MGNRGEIINFVITDAEAHSATWQIKH